MNTASLERVSVYGISTIPVTAEIAAILTRDGNINGQIDQIIEGQVQ